MLEYSFENITQQTAFFNLIREDYLYNFSWALNQPFIGPRTLQLNLTIKCNLKCIMCSTWQMREEDFDGALKDVSVNYLKKIVDNTFEMGNLKEVIFTGGEALLRHDSFNLIKYVKDYYPGVQTILNTNGLLLNKENIGRLINIKLDVLSVSIDSPSPEIHNALRGEHVFERVVEAIKYFNAEKTRANAKFPILVICSVLMNQTLDTIFGMINFCITHGITSIVIQPYVPNVDMAISHRNDKFWIPQERLQFLREVLNKIEAQKSKITNLNIEISPDKIYKYFSEQLYIDNKCYSGFTQVLLTGSVIQFICSGQDEEEYKYLATIQKAPVNELWFSQKASFIRDTIKRCKRKCVQFCISRSLSDSVTEIHRRVIEQKSLFLIFQELRLLEEYMHKYPALPLREIINSDYGLVTQNLDKILMSFDNLRLDNIPQESQQYLLNDLELVYANFKKTDKDAHLLSKKDLTENEKVGTSDIIKNIVSYKQAIKDMLATKRKWNPQN